MKATANKKYKKADLTDIPDITVFNDSLDMIDNDIGEMCTQNNHFADSLNKISSEMEAKANGNWTFFSSYGEIGIEVGKETINDLLRNMTDRSILKVSVNVGLGYANIYPGDYGALTIERVILGRAYIRFTDTFNSAAWMGLCYNGNFTGWIRMLASNMSIVPDEDNVYDVGSATRRIRNIVTATAPIISSDSRIKKGVDVELKDYIGFFLALKVRFFEYTDTGKEEYERRIHCGFYAQEVFETMEKHNISTLDFAGFIASPIYKETLKRDKDGNILYRSDVIDVGGTEEPIQVPDTEKYIADCNFGLRYEEFIALTVLVVQTIILRQERFIEILSNKGILSGDDIAYLNLT